MEMWEHCAFKRGNMNVKLHRSCDRLQVLPRLIIVCLHWLHVAATRLKGSFWCSCMFSQPHCSGSEDDVFVPAELQNSKLLWHLCGYYSFHILASNFFPIRLFFFGCSWPPNLFHLTPRSLLYSTVTPGHQEGRELYTPSCFTVWETFIHENVWREFKEVNFLTVVVVCRVCVSCLILFPVFLI